MLRSSVGQELKQVMVGVACKDPNGSGDSNG